MSSSDEDFILAAYCWSKVSQKRKLKRKRVDWTSEKNAEKIPLYQSSEAAQKIVNEVDEVSDASAMDCEQSHVEREPQVMLESNEVYDDCCGKFIITRSRYLILHCSLCNNKYGTLLNFLKHLKMHQYSTEEIETVEKNWSNDSEYPKENLQETFKHENELNIKPELHAVETESHDGNEDNEFLPESNAFESESHEADEDSILPTLYAVDSENHCVEENKNEVESSDADDDWNNSHSDKSANKEQSPSSLEFRSMFSTFATRSHDHKCSMCERIFSTKGSLNIHALSHSNAKHHKCTLCGVEFKYKSNLVSHIRRHNGVKRFSCETCDKRFFTSSAAKHHQRTHAGEKPFICFKCGKAFIASGGLYEHMKRHNNVRPEKCEVCGNRFYNKKLLNLHMVRHTNERSFVCTHCPSSFARKTTLRQHLKLHINAKEYKCTMCKKSFNQRPALLCHIKHNHK